MIAMHAAVMCPAAVMVALAAMHMAVFAAHITSHIATHALLHGRRGGRSLTAAQRLRAPLDLGDPGRIR
ncbi:MAG TPA: hypothetical protein VF797_04690, partial [Noviherbaspirillum sp.]